MDRCPTLWLLILTLHQKCHSTLANTGTLNQIQTKFKEGLIHFTV